MTPLAKKRYWTTATLYCYNCVSRHTYSERSTSGLDTLSERSNWIHLCGALATERFPKQTHPFFFLWVPDTLGILTRKQRPQDASDPRTFNVCVSFLLMSRQNETFSQVFKIKPAVRHRTTVNASVFGRMKRNVPRATHTFPNWCFWAGWIISPISNMLINILWFLGIEA